MAAASVGELGQASLDGSPDSEADALKSAAGDLDTLAQRGYGNEHLDQLVIDVLLGVR
jgi:xylose isomerase